MEKIESSKKPGPASNKEWTKGSITRNVLALSMPIMVSDGLRTIGPTIDMIWVGKLGAVSLAALGIGGMINLLVMLGIMGINTGMRALIARHVGAGDSMSANHVAQQAFIISACYATFVAVIGFLFAEQILGLLGVEADVVKEGAPYVRITFAGTAAMSFGMLAEGIMQASGDSVTPMRISVFYRFLHMTACPFLVFRWGIFPRLGIAGAAIASVGSQGLGMVLGLFVLFTGRSRISLVLRNFRFDHKTVWRIIRIGIPTSIGMSGRCVGRLLFFWLMAPFGTVAVASHAIVERVEVFLTTPGFGFSRGTAVLVGQNLGAKQPERAERSCWVGVGFVEITILAFSVVILYWPESIIRIFSSDPELVRESSIFLRIMMVGLIAIGFSVVIQGCLAGAGDTIPPMIITILSMIIVPVPLSLFLIKFTDLGPYGVRWAIVSGLVVGALVYGIYFRLGRWKHKEI
jgi:putative MATE family efflux protein